LVGGGGGQMVGQRVVVGVVVVVVWVGVCPCVWWRGKTWGKI
jgi:hypothetical protein